MRVLLSALREYLPLPEKLDIDKLACTLTMSGIEVEAIEKLSPAVQGAFVVEITAIEPHPTKKDLSLCTLFDGSQTKKVVSSAKNITKGMITAFAPIGATVGLKTPVTIQPVAFDGVSSEGMLLSEKEMELTSDASGIIDLSGYRVGTPVEELFCDIAFELGLTPNLGHVMSVYGVARQIAALLDMELKVPAVKASSEWKKEPLATVEAEELIPHYSAVKLDGIKVTKTPLAIRLELERSGLHCVNSIVDCLNFVTLRLGTPLHAFDAATIEGGKLIVMAASGTEKTKILGGAEITVPQNAIIIRDKSAVCALGGVIGSLSHAVSDTTTSIVIEAAYFDPMSIRRTRKALNLNTEASRLFEKGTDPRATVRALECVHALLKKIFPELVVKGFCDIQKKEFLDKRIFLRRQHASHVLGIEVSLKDIELCFARLGFPVEWNGDACTVSVPPFRHDIHEEIDLIEEIWQVLQPNVVPKGDIAHVTPKLADSTLYRFSEKIRETLLREGLQELLTCTLISPQLVDKVKNHPINPEEIIRVIHPMSEDQSILRPSLLPSMLDVVQNNVKVKNHSLSGFEVSNVHFRKNNKYVEQAVVGIVLYGNRNPDHFEAHAEKVDFLDLKGIVENLMCAMSVEKITFAPSSLEVFHPYRQSVLVVNDMTIGTLGQIHPSIVRALDIPQEVFVAEINIVDMINSPKKEIRYQELSLFPSSERDWTITVTEEMGYEKIAAAIEAHKGNLIESYALVSIFRDEKIGVGKKNISLRFVFRNPKRTIEQEEVDKDFARLVKATSLQLNL